MTTDKRWEPVEDGTYSTESRVLNLFIDGGMMQARDTADKYVYAIIPLPDNLRLCRLVDDEPQPLDMPDGTGWWAFRGHYRERGNELMEGNFEFVYRVIERKGELHVDMLLDYDWPVMQLVGKWYRLTMPWDEKGS